MNWCILIPALVGLLCGILGYLLGKLLGGGSNNIDEWKRKNAKLEADLDACRSKLSAKGPSAASTSSSIASSFASSNDSSGSGGSISGGGMAVAAFNADAAKGVFGKRIKENDLTVVEGIGPKIQELFHNHDVKTWVALAGCSVDKCRQVLDSGGKRFQMHNPGSWPKQAGLAAEGKWQELLDLQDSLDGGK